METQNSLMPSWLTKPTDLNSLNSKIWPESMVRGPEGEVSIGGVGVSALAASFGTPLFVIDEADFRSRATAVREIFESEAAAIGTSAKVYYAGKAFLSTGVVRWLDELGLNLDTASGGELAVALAGGINPSRIGLHGNNKSLFEIGRAVSANLGAIVIDSEIEIERIASVAGAQDKIQPVRLRVNTGVHAHTHDYLATAREDQKFGIALTDVAELVERIRSHSHLKFLGLHSHIGSQIFKVDGFLAAVERLVPLHAQLLKNGDVPELNLGGGFGINYTSADDAPNLRAVVREIMNAVSTACHRLGIPVPTLAFEPGRVIAGPAGITLYNVGTIKDVLVGEEGATDSAVLAASEGQVRKYVSIDGGMSDNLRAALYDADYSCSLVSRASQAGAALSRVVGKHCESGDIVVKADYLPADVAPNDLLAVAATGAYCFSLSSNYNYLTKPGVVAVRDGEAKVLIRAETEVEMLQRDSGFTGSVAVEQK